MCVAEAQYSNLLFIDCTFVRFYTLGGCEWVSQYLHMIWDLFKKCEKIFFKKCSSQKAINPHKNHLLVFRDVTEL